MLSEKNKKIAEMIGQGIPVCTIAKEFNVSRQSIYKLMKLNNEFARLVFWEKNKEKIKRICKFLAYHYKFEYDELYNLAYIETFESKSLLTSKEPLGYLKDRIKIYCRKEITHKYKQQNIDFTNPLNEQFLNDYEDKFFK